MEKGLSIGKVSLGLLPRVVGVVSEGIALSLSEEVMEQVDILELRIDTFKDHSVEYIKEAFNLIRRRFEKPLIATVRDEKEGGYRRIDNRYKCEIYESIIPLSDAIDIEIDSEIIERIVPICKVNNKTVIGSYHNLQETPAIEYLNDIVLKGRACGADIIKIAVMANTMDDIARLTSFTINNKEKGLVTISLGDTGLISRIFNPMIGSLMTYGHLGVPAAPGQISVEEIINYLKRFIPMYNIALTNRMKMREYV